MAPPIIEKKKGRRPKDKNPPESIEKMKRTFRENQLAGKHRLTMNGWKRPGQNRGGWRNRAKKETED